MFCWESVVPLVTDATHFNFLKDIDAWYAFGAKPVALETTWSR